MAGTFENNIVKALPFAGLTDFQLEYEFRSDKISVQERFNNTKIFEKLGHKFDRNVPVCDYYDEEQFNMINSGLNCDLSIMHMNIRKLSKHRGELVAYLSCLNLKFDVIVLTEIGRDASHYVSSVFPEYNCHYILPENNEYGGVAIYTTKNITDVKERNDLKMTKICNCSQCQI